MPVPCRALSRCRAAGRARAWAGGLALEPDDAAQDLAGPQVIVAFSDVVEGVLGGDELVDLELARPVPLGYWVTRPELGLRRFVILVDYSATTRFRQTDRRSATSRADCSSIAVKQFAAEGPIDALADGVHSRRLRQGGSDPQSFGLEHLAERGGEDRIAINQDTGRYTLDSAADVKPRPAHQAPPPTAGTDEKKAEAPAAFPRFTI